MSNLLFLPTRAQNPLPDSVLEPSLSLLPQNCSKALHPFWLCASVRSGMDPSLSCEWCL